MITPSLRFLFIAGKFAPHIAGSTASNKAIAALGATSVNSADISEEWLVRANERYRRDSIAQKQRSFKALLEYTKETNTIIDFSSSCASRVFEWFKARSAADAHHIGSLFTGSYFFDAYFWPVSVPVFWGSLKLNALEALETMPDPVRQELQEDRDELWNYVLYWADCADYGCGFDDIRRFKTLGSKTWMLLNNGDRELRAAIALLNSPRPNPKAILTARMGTEIFLKAFLVEKGNATERQLKKLGHDIIGLTDAANVLCQLKEFEIIKSLAHLFPPLDDRYSGLEKDFRSVSNGLCLCQLTAATVIRQFCDRDIRQQIFQEHRPKE